MAKRKRLQFALVSLAKREFARKGRSKKYITTTVASGRPLGDLPRGFNNWRDGWSWQPITEVRESAAHSGPDKLIFEDHQVARLIRIIAKEKA
jgi:hypothetical protein